MVIGEVSKEHKPGNSKNGPLIIVARPRAVPIPLPRMALGPTRLNLSNKVRVISKIDHKRTRDLHGGILQHIWHNKESNHTSPDIHLI